MLRNLLRLAVYLASVLISVEYADNHWIVGLVFGLAVVAWDSDLFKKLAPVRHLAFICTSTLIYALVYYISSQRWPETTDLRESLVGPLPVAIIVGSVLLPIAHRFLLKTTDKHFARTIPLLIVTYYVITIASLAHDHWNLHLPINFLFVLIAAWQGIYLHCFYNR